MKLPDRIIVPTCIACGAMGRAASCEADCSEHRLPLVAAADLDALRDAGRAARAELELLAPLVRSLIGQIPPEPACPAAYRALRASVRSTSERLQSWDRNRRWAAPDTAVGWWCAECGNVDAPQPCLGVCIWQRVEWVNASLYSLEYERSRDELQAARELTAILARVAGVTPKPGRCVETWEALQSQARAAAGSWLT